MKKNQKNDEQYIKNPSEPDEKADELNENGPTSEKRTDSIIETGSIIASNGKYTIHCLTIIGQIEGHYILSSQNKTTKYEHYPSDCCCGGRTSYRWASHSAQYCWR